MGGDYESGSGRDAYGPGLEGGSIGGSYGMEGGYSSGVMGGDFGYEAGKGAHGMGGYGGARHGMGGGYGGGSESGAGGLRGGYGSEFGNGAPACVDELPSDYKDSVCYTRFNETSCKIIATDASQCDMLWLDTGCSQHEGLVRDTCRKSCGTCKSSGHSRNLQTGWTDYRLNPYKGQKYCDGGGMVTTAEECKRACKYLGLPIKEILPRWFCYADFKGECYANSHSGPGAQLI